jgi:hypothetical protein
MDAAPLTDDPFKPGETLYGRMTHWFWGRSVAFEQDESYKLTKDGIIYTNIRKSPAPRLDDRHFSEPLPLILPHFKDPRRMWWIMKYLAGWNPDRWFHVNWGLGGPPYEPKPMKLGRDEEY